MRERDSPETMTILEDRIKELLVESLKNLKNLDPAYQNLKLDDDFVVVGPGSPLDSIGFMAFATDFEEKIENETGKAFMLKIEDLYASAQGKPAISLEAMAGFAAKLLNGD